MDFPAIKERAKKENAEINWGDETGCQNETNYVKGYAPIGQTPVMPVGNEHLRVNMISAITNQGKLRFMFYRTSMNANVLIEFLKRLVKGATRKILTKPATIIAIVIIVALLAGLRVIDIRKKRHSDDGDENQ